MFRGDLKNKLQTCQLLQTATQRDALVRNLSWTVELLLAGAEVVTA